MSNFVHLHLGLGDHIICLPIFSYLSKYRSLTLPVWSHNYITMQELTKNLDNVFLFPVTSETQMKTNKAKYKLGLYAMDQPKGKDFVEWQWEGYDREKLLKEHNVIRDLVGKLPDQTDEIFIHDDSTRNFNIKLEGFRPTKELTMKQNILMMLSCKEIHCIDSAFLQVVESFNLPDHKLFYHKYARPHSAHYTSFRNQWKIIE